MRGPLVFIAFAVLISVESRSEDTDSRLLVEFDAAVAKIALRSSGRPIQLPSLTFAVRIEAICPVLLEARTISISIADTRVNFRPDNLANTGPIEETIRVPEKQLGPIAVNDFCIAGDDVNTAQQLQIRDALTAQLSLRCVGENRESIHYETVALELALQCDLPENAESL